MRPPRALAHRAGHAWEQALLPLLARDAELILSPANLAPAASARNVIVIHDVAALRHPEWYGRAYVAWQRALLPLLARRARKVITVSEFARREIADVLGVDASVASPGVGERFSPASDPGPARRAFGLDRPYVLTVGTRIARKNSGALAAAAAALAGNGIELVGAGSGRAYMRAGAGGAVRALGYVDERLLPGLYAGARAFVLPSLYEGFGIPCLEAMASGVPVVASDRGALPETCGDAALLVDPTDRERLAAAVLAAACEDGTRRELVARGRARAGNYTWQRMAERVDAAIEAA